MKAPIKTEFTEQCTVVSWARWQSAKYPQLAFLHSSLSGVKLRPIQAIKAKQNGMIKGIPDLFLPCRSIDGRYSGLFIEMKRVKLSKVSEEQIKFGEFVTSQGFLFKICKGADEAINLIKSYLIDR